MDNTPNPNPVEPDLKDLQAQCDSLQQLVSSLLLVLIVISGTLSVFLLRQYRFVKSEFDALIPAATQLMTEHTNNYAMTQDFVKKLAEYGRTHPDFTQIVAKYRLNESLPKAAAGPGSVTGSLPTQALPKK